MRVVVEVNVKEGKGSGVGWGKVEGYESLGGSGVGGEGVVLLPRLLADR